MSKVKGFFLYTAFFAVLLLSACSDFHAPVKDFLDEYANRAAIGSQAISVPTERDIDGIECVSSATDVTITFFLRNPRSYVIEPEFLPKISGPTPGTDYTLSQSPDRQSITLTFLQAFLESHDMGGDLSGTISLSEAATGRPFPSWDFTLRCNTPPPRPEGARVMLDTDTNTYVLCFNLDLTNPVHGDLASFTIEGEYFDISPVQAGDPQGITITDPRLSVTQPDTLSPVGSLPPFVPDPGSLQVYFSSDILQTAGTQNFTVTVRDAMGLSRTASTSSAGDMLAPVTVTDIDNNPPVGTTLTLVPDGSDEYQVLLSHADDAATIYYIYEGTPGSATGPFPAVLTFTQSGDLEVWATRTGYVDSDHRTIHLICRNNQYYVDPASGDDSNPGTRSQPFKTIEHAITRFSDSTDEENTIFLLGDVTSLNRGGSTGIVDIIPAEDITFTIDGSEAPGGVATINGSDSVRCLYVNAGSSAVNLTLRNLIIRDGRVDNNGPGAGINFEAADNGSSLTLDGCVVEENDVVDASWGGGVYFAGGELTIENTQIRNNTIAQSAGSLYGAGIYISGVGSSATATISSEAGPVEITGNYGTTTNYGQGGGIYARNVDLIITGATISDNTANKAGTGQGGGIYIVNTTTSTTTFNLTGVDINTNRASTGSTGYGGGIYATCTNGGSTNINLTGETRITGNTASLRDGLGGGMFLSSNTNASTVGLSSPEGSNVEISGNRATTGSTAFGYGGGIYVDQGGQVVWEDGTISGNWANQAGTGVTFSQGEGIYIDGASGYATQFTFTGGSIARGSIPTATNNVVYLGHDVLFLFEGDAAITDGKIYLDSDATNPPEIIPKGLLTAPLVAHLVPNDYARTEPILDQNAAINYYKFTVEPYSSVNYCINADGELSEITERTASTTADIANYLASAPTDGKTLEIELNNITNNTSTFIIQANAHVRIFPNSDLSHNANAQLFRIMNGGHLLFGDPAQNIEIDLQYSDRQQHLFYLVASGSLVLRNVTVKNAQQLNLGSLSNAALVASGSTTGTSTVVLEDFVYYEDITISYPQSTQSALQLYDGSVYHFVSGSITGFNVLDSGYGGVANIEGTGQLTIHGGTFSGNTTHNGNSVSGELTGLNPPGLVLE